MIVNDCLEDVKKKVGGVHQMKVTTFDASLYLHIYISIYLHIYIFMQFCDTRLVSFPYAP